MAKAKLLKLGSTKDAAKDIETIDLFELDDVVYSVPAEVSAGVSLAYLEKQAEEGPDAAIFFIMKKLLGDEAFDALKNHPNLKKDELEAVMSAVEGHVLADDSGK